MIGPAAAVTAPARAPDWHVEPDPTAETHPTRAWPATFPAYLAGSAKPGACPVMPPPAYIPIEEISVTAQARRAGPRLPVLTPATMVLTAVATKIAQAGLP